MSARRGGDQPMSIYDHLDELRRRLLIVIIAVVIATAGAFFFAIPILTFLERPMHGYTLHYTGPLEPLYALLKISIGVGLIVAGPIVLYQIVAFVMPALTRRERRLLYAYLPVAVVLFFAGLGFGFFVFIPLVLSAMFRLSGTTLQPILTVGQYTSFLISFMLPFGAVFELPVVVVLLVKLGILSASTLAKGRRYAILVSALVAAIFAPPDPVTPLVMATPIYLLYEVSIWVARLASRSRRSEDQDERGGDDGPGGGDDGPGGGDDGPGGGGDGPGGGGWADEGGGRPSSGGGDDGPYGGGGTADEGGDAASGGGDVPADGEGRGGVGDDRPPIADDDGPREPAGNREAAPGVTGRPRGGEEPAEGGDAPRDSGKSPRDD